MQHSGEVGSVVYVLYQISTKFENRLRFDKVTESWRVGTFWDTV